ncbi:MAG: hypothetical protein JW891_09485 [Candidatus Lokiarchaeota archaeon]|nr:hypothetical protein [Candidatus Lokiarchaeota archaeon]
MVECKYIANCPFFNNKMSNMPKTATLFKERYCKADNSRCARLMVSKNLGKEMGPSDLFPNQIERAYNLINS